MLQPGIHELLGALLQSGRTVLLETGGQVLLADVDARVHKIVDFKCPSSGMMEHNDYDNVRCLTMRDEVKFVVGDRSDFDWACALIREHDLAARVAAVLVSPVSGRLPFDLLAGWVLECGLEVRLGLQLHKIIWPGIPRGV